MVLVRVPAPDLNTGGRTGALQLQAWTLSCEEHVFFVLVDTVAPLWEPASSAGSRGLHEEPRGEEVTLGTVPRWFSGWVLHIFVPRTSRMKQMVVVSERPAEDGDGGGGGDGTQSAA